MISLEAALIKIVKTFNLDVEEAKMRQTFIDLFPSGGGRICMNKCWYFLFDAKAKRFLLEHFNLNLMDEMDGVSLSIIIVENQGKPQLGILYLPHFKNIWRFKP